MSKTSNYNKTLLDDYQKLEIKNNELSKENSFLKYEYKLLEKKYNCLEQRNTCLENQLEDLKQQAIEKLNQKHAKEIEEKDNEIARLKALLNNDGTNSNIPTSKTPINKKKQIPNERKKSNKIIGGQKNHKKHKLEKFKDEEVNEIEYIELDKCPHCNGQLLDTNETIDKDVFDYVLLPVKKRIKFKKYKCSCCCKEVHSKIPTELKEENQYGPNVKALVLQLLNEGYVSINRVKRIIKGLTEGEIDLSEGFIAKVQKNASKKLEDFNNELKLKLLKKELIYWDDTVIFVDKKRACLRFYGDEKIAYYTAHEHKNKEGLDKDGVLNSVDSKTKLMHDHNKVNYNAEYSFINLECNAHLQRDLQKAIDNLKSEWAGSLKRLISESIKERENYIEKNQTYNEEFSKKFFDEFDEIMLSAIEENKEHGDVYYADKEKTLILRLLDYKDNYFAWVCDFKLPTTNNLSERSLRSSKTKLKVSGQFRNIDRAKDFAIIKSYIETSYRNGINPYNALFKLSLGVPLTVCEILGEEK